MKRNLRLNTGRTWKQAPNNNQDFTYILKKIPISYKYTKLDVHEVERLIITDRAIFWEFFYSFKLIQILWKDQKIWDFCCFLCEWCYLLQKSNAKNTNLNLNFCTLTDVQCTNMSRSKEENIDNKN